MLKTKEIEALKALAAANLESALMAAVRMGATKSSEAAKPIKRAAEMLDFDAECLRGACAPYGNWSGCAEEKADYDERKKIAKQLRGLIVEG